MKVYKIFDEDYQEICGINQLIKFAENQLYNNDDEFLEKYKNQKLTFNDIIEILNYRDFKVKEIEVY